LMSKAAYLSTAAVLLGLLNGICSDRTVVPRNERASPAAESVFIVKSKGSGSSKNSGNNKEIFWTLN
jgi:hypothetical protein